jgi:hypothetical protein
VNIGQAVGRTTDDGRINSDSKRFVRFDPASPTVIGFAATQSR